jgi:hypothetical protein
MKKFHASNVDSIGSTGGSARTPSLSRFRLETDGLDRSESESWNCLGKEQVSENLELSIKSWIMI